MENEQRLIYANALKERIRQGPMVWMFTDEILEEIDEVPTVDALIPPVKPWDKVWVIDKILDRENGRVKKTICEGEIVKLSYNGFTTPMEWIDYRWDSLLVGQTARHDRIDLCIGKTVFLTRKEAEAALAKMGLKEV